MNKSTPLFYQDGEKLLRMRSLAKRRKERVEVLEALLKHYKADYSAAFDKGSRLRQTIALKNMEITDLQYEVMVKSL